MLMVSSVCADPTITQVAAPTAPVVAATPSNTTNETTVNSEGSANKVYVDQVGDNINMNSMQTGTGNKLGSGLTTNGVYLRGNNQTITTIQNGIGNDIEMNLNTGTGNGASANVMINQVGDNNSINATCGMGQSAICTNFNAIWKFVGDSNSLSFTGSGATINSAIDTTGDGNSFVIQATDRANQLITVTGNNNAFNVDQFAGGANGQSLNVTLHGDSNTFTSAQGGAVDSLIHVNAVSNNGTFNFNINGAH